MTRICPVCRAHVGLDDTVHCPECSAALDRDRPAADSGQVDDILETVRQQINALDDGEDVPAAPGDVEQGDRDIDAVLSDFDLQRELNENSDADDRDVSAGYRSSPESSPQSAYSNSDRPDSGRADGIGAEYAPPLGRALHTLKQSQSFPAAGDRSAAGGHAVGSERADTPEVSAGLQSADIPMPDYYIDEEIPPEPKKRTWFGITRQACALFLLLLVCLALFRYLQPEKEELTIESFFRPGNPDVEFLEAIEFLERYYARQRDQRDVTDSRAGEYLLDDEFLDQSFEMPEDEYSAYPAADEIIPGEPAAEEER